MPHQGKIGRSIEMNNEFMVMDEEELLDVDGGAVWLVVGGVYFPQRHFLSLSRLMIRFY